MYIGSPVVSRKEPKFEYDPNKSEKNIALDRVNFEIAKRVWDDEDAIAIQARNTTEERLAIHGVVDGKSWTVIYAMRGDVMRIISCRPGRRNERKWYYDGKDQTKKD